MSLARGCGLGIPICAYLWRVTRDEVDGGAVFSTGLSFSPKYVEMSCLVTLRTCYLEDRNLGNVSCTPLVPEWAGLGTPF
jgi:hypothetical protein